MPGTLSGPGLGVRVVPGRILKRAIQWERLK
jgi:hypothetical protein